MWKPIAASAALLLCGPALAHDIYLHGDHNRHCEAELNYSVRVGPDFFDIREEKEDSRILLRYRAPDQLTVEDKRLQLDPGQQQLVRDYQRQLHGAGRELLLLSLEAADVALNGISTAMIALAGPNHPDSLELQRASGEMLRRTEERLNRNGEVYFLGDADIDEFIEESVTEEFVPEIEKLAAESAGNIAWHAIKAVFTGGRSIEQEAEQLARDVEQKVERRAEQLGRRADRLCESFRSIDRLERDLHQSIPALAPYDFVKVD